MSQKSLALRMALASMLLLVLGWLTAVSPISAQTNAADTAVAWLTNTHQNSDGGFSSFSSGANQAPSDVGGTLDALLAMAAAGSDTAAPLAYLQTQATDLLAYVAGDGGSGGKALLALTTAGADPRSFAGHDLAAAFAQSLPPNGEFGANNSYAHALAILGLAATGEAVPQTAVAWLLSVQGVSGAWDDGFGTADNVDATAMAIMALTAAGLPDSDPNLVRAAEFLRQAHTAAGWEYAAGFGANANSSALAIQALSALGDDVTPYLDQLLSWQGSSGAFQADFGSGPFDDFFTTVQAVPALTGQPYPLNLQAGAARAASPAPTAPAVSGVINILAIVVAVMALLIAVGAALLRRRA